MTKPTILTGLRANSNMHLGNYFGAMLPMVELQNKYVDQGYQLNMFVPDLHSFITPIDHTKLYTQSIENARVYIAAGIKSDHDNVAIYRQSFVPAHSELTWILDNFTYMGELSRMTQFKDKSAGEKNVNVGLFGYPVLMAADILLYNAQWVPVGEDQQQHLELTRDLALRMNGKFGELFTVPEEWKKQVEFAGRGAGTRIRSLKNPEKKMSKSIDDPAGTILLNDDPDEAAKKVMSATTDSVGAIHFDFETQPGVSNLLVILSLLSGVSVQDVTAEWEGKSSYGELKNVVAEHVKQFLIEFQSKYQAVDERTVLAKLESSEKAMNTVANETLLRVQKAVGLRAA